MPFNKPLRKAVFLLGLFLAPAWAMAQPAAIGHLTYSEGRVEQSGPGVLQYKPLVKDQVLCAGDCIRTKSYSKAEITFADHSILRLAENTQIRIQDYVVDDAQALRKKAFIALDRGTIRATVSKANPPAGFVVQTPNAFGTIKGSDMFVSYQKSATAVLALEGKMALHHLAFPDKVVDVGPQRTALVAPEAPAQEARTFAPFEQKRLEQQTDPTLSAQIDGKQVDLSKALITKVAGDVLSRVGKAGAWHKVQNKEALGSGDEIQTRGDAQVEIVLESGRIIQLRPHSQLTVRKLSRDPKTGAREDLFESTLGKIRVSVDKLKANSKFEIKTPTAIAGVRGTVMYLDISPVRTMAFFEGGTGYLGNPTQEVVQDVGAGQNATADDGHVSDPVQTTDEQRSDFETGWDPQAQTYGYGNAQPQADGDSDEDWAMVSHDESPSAMSDEEATQQTEQLFDEKPPESTDTDAEDDEDSPTASQSSSSSTQSTVYSMDWALTAHGYFGSGSSFEENQQRVWSASLSDNTDSDFWSGKSVSGVSVSGRFVHADPPSLWWGDVQGSSSDRGQFFGRMGGSWHSWEGSLVAITLDPSGMGGLASAGLVGTSDETVGGAFSGSGTLRNTRVQQTGIVPSANWTSSLSRGSISQGLIIGEFESGQGESESRDFLRGDLSEGHSYFLNGASSQSHSLPWGIWDIKLGGNNMYRNPENLRTWSAGFGGQGSFGEIRTGMADTGYWLADVEGGSWADNLIRGDFSGYYLTYTQKGEIDGDVFGLYAGQNAGEWSGVGLSIFRGDLLDFAGKVHGDFVLFDRERNLLSSMGEAEGIVGGRGNLWGGAELSNVLAMGSFEVPSVSRPLLWAWDADSFDAASGRQTTMDGGAFAGSMGGVWKDGQLSGFAKMLTIQPQSLGSGPNAGILSGDFAGLFFEDDQEVQNGFWYALGDETVVLAGTTSISPLHLLDRDSNGNFVNIEEECLSGTGLGRYADGGGLRAVVSDWSVLNITDQQWGIWRARIGGVFTEPTDTFRLAIGSRSNSNEGGVWLSTLVGSWQQDSGGLSSGTLVGESKGVWISIPDPYYDSVETFQAIRMTGQIVGTHETAGSWQAVGLGEGFAVTDLDPQAVGYSMDQLREFVSIPITEQYTSLLAASGDFNGGAGDIAAVMDTSFYSSDSPSQGIWTGLLNGTFQDMPSTVANWFAVVSGSSDAGPVSAQLNGVQWANGQWLANVQSDAQSSLNIAGQAGGTYTTNPTNASAGTFQGVGTGTWSTNTSNSLRDGE